MAIDPQPPVAECEEMAAPPRWHALQASMWMHKDTSLVPGQAQVALLIAQTHALTALALYVTEPAAEVGPEP